SRGSVRAGDFDGFWEQALRQGGWWDQGTTGGPAVTGAGTPPPAPQNPTFDGGEGDYPYYFVPFLSAAWSAGSTANLPWMQEMPDPTTTAAWGSWVELNPETARRLGIKQNDVVEVQSAHGSVRAPVFIYPGIRPDVVSMPFGQGHDAYGQYARKRG